MTSSHLCKRVVSGCIIAARNQALSMASPEDEEEKKCRVCWGDEDDGPLVQPCVCRGSMKWIHERCLEKWRRTGARVDAAYRCGQCMDKYRDALSLELLSARLQAERTDGLATNLTLSTLASELEEQGKYDEAETLYREAMEAMRETLGSRHPSTLTSLSNLGQLLHRKGDLDAAGPLLREAVEGMRATLGIEHPVTLNSVCALSSLLRDEGDLAAAETLLREAQDVARERFGNQHLITLTFIHCLILLQCKKGDLAAAVPLLREALEGLRTRLGNRHESTLFSMCQLAACLSKEGDFAAAEPLFREAVEGLRQTLGVRHPSTFAAMIDMRAHSLRQKRENAAAIVIQREFNPFRLRRDTSETQHHTTDT